MQKAIGVCVCGMEAWKTEVICACYKKGVSSGTLQRFFLSSISIHPTII